MCDHAFAPGNRSAKNKYKPQWRAKEVTKAHKGESPDLKLFVRLLVPFVRIHLPFIRLRVYFVRLSG
mgnify:CR=1 FL=1